MSSVPERIVRLIPGIALPDYMTFILESCEPIGYTRRAIEAGHLLVVDYHPPYVQVKCRDVNKVVFEARRRGLRVYYGKKHVTITDGVYHVRIYLASI